MTRPSCPLQGGVGEGNILSTMYCFIILYEASTLSRAKSDTKTNAQSTVRPAKHTSSACIDPIGPKSLKPPASDVHAASRNSASLKVTL